MVCLVANPRVSTYTVGSPVGTTRPQMCCLLYKWLNCVMIELCKSFFSILFTAITSSVMASTPNCASAESSYTAAAKETATDSTPLKNARRFAHAATVSLLI
jgi:hypothetical protein